MGIGSLSREPRGQFFTLDWPIILRLPILKRLIVNADDFGFNREITDGIVESHQHGIVTSTTLMVNMPAVEYAIEQAQHCPGMSIGLHVNLTLGRPISDPTAVPSLLRSDGQFLDRATFFRRANFGKLQALELRKEIKAQLDRMVELGLTPTHIDSHHHSLSCVQSFFAVLRVLKATGITRMRTHSGWYRRDPLAKQPWRNVLATWKKNLLHSYRVYYELQHAYAAWRRMQMPHERLIFPKIVASRRLGFNMESASSFLAAIRDGVTELSCHPGHYSDDPMDNDKMRRSRPQELAFLTDPLLKEAVDAYEIRLINFAEF